MSRETRIKILILGGCFVLYCLFLYLFPPVAFGLLIGLLLKFGRDLKRGSQTIELQYLDDDIVCVNHAVFIKVFSCPIPQHLPDMAPLKFFVPLSIEVLPQSQELRFFLYSQNVGELKNRCQRAQKVVLRNLPLIKSVSPVQLKKIFAETKVHTIEDHHYVEQGNKMYTCVNASLDVFKKELQQYFHKNITQEVRIVLPFITHQALAQTKTKRKGASAFDWASGRLESETMATSFKGVELYAQKMDALDQERLISQLDKNSLIPLRIRLRYPFQASEALPIERGVQYLTELIQSRH